MRQKQNQKNHSRHTQKIHSSSSERIHKHVACGFNMIFTPNNEKKKAERKRNIIKHGLVIWKRSQNTLEMKKYEKEVENHCCRFFWFNVWLRKVRKKTLLAFDIRNCRRCFVFNFHELRLVLVMKIIEWMRDLLEMLATRFWLEISTFQLLIHGQLKNRIYFLLLELGFQ